MFQGFTQETVDFMWGIRFNNEKSWFEDHRRTYLDSFYNPMRELAGEVYDHLSGELPDCGLVCRVSRIYRDARRLHGRGPYKDHLWFSVERPCEDRDRALCFWFELGPESWGYGLGYYLVRPATMARLRSRLDADPGEMEKLTRRLNRQREFRLEGEEYKRPKGAAPSKVLEPWYRKKNFSISHEEKLTDELFSRDVGERVRKGFDFLVPYFQYFMTLDGDPEPEKT